MKKDNIETAVKYLQQIHNQETQIQMMKYRIQELKARAGIQGIRYDTVHVQAGEKGKAVMADSVIQYTTLEQKVEQRTKDLEAFKETALNRLMALPDVNEYMVLVKRYFERKTFGDISAEIGYSLRQTRRFHDKGLIHLNEILEADSGESND